VQAAAGDDLLAAAGFALDQHREGGVGVLPDLRAQLLHGDAVAEQAAGVLRGFRHGGQFRRLVGQDVPQGLPQLLRVGRLGDELGRAEGAGMARVGFVVLPGEHDDLDVRRVGKQVGDEREALVGLVRQGRQAEVDQGQLRRGALAAQQGDAVGAGAGRGDLEFAAQKERQGVDDERVVIDDEQGRLAGFRGSHADACLIRKINIFYYIRPGQRLPFAMCEISRPQQN
jgi:hypothetical protein